MTFNLQLLPLGGGYIYLTLKCLHSSTVNRGRQLRELEGPYKVLKAELPG